MCACFFHMRHPPAPPTVPKCCALSNQMEGVLPPFMQSKPGALVTAGAARLASLYAPQSGQLQNKKIHMFPPQRLPRAGSPTRPTPSSDRLPVPPEVGAPRGYPARASVPTQRLPLGKGTQPPRRGHGWALSPCDTLVTGF